MAVTKIWDIKGNIGRLLAYAGNPDKVSENITVEYSEADIMDMTDLMDLAMLDERASELEHWRSDGVSNAIDYAVQNHKTEEKRHVTGINCSPENARDNMMITKRTWQKLSGNTAYHGFQSFRPGEVIAETAHEIGIKLADKLWGDRHEVVVATHVDRGHIHNHYVLNSVSFVDGKKYNDCTATYMKMRNESDALCREYGLSVIENPQHGKTKHYSEWNAERNGHTTWRSMIKSDIDAAIRRSMTERQFIANLRDIGYEIKAGKDISVKPPGKERFVRLQRNFGDDYTIEGIRIRILAQTRPERIVIPPETSSQIMKYKGVYHKPHKKSGLRDLYVYYLYRMGALPVKKQQEPSIKQIYFLYREDIRYIRRLSEETRLLVKNEIDTDIQLTAHMENIKQQITILTNQRQQLRNKTRSIKDNEKLAIVKTEISDLSKFLSKLRREDWLCKDIEKRSGIMADKISKEREGIQNNIQTELSPQNQIHISR